MVILDLQFQLQVYIIHPEGLTSPRGRRAFMTSLGRVEEKNAETVLHAIFN
jgi:hypothetical protein